MLESEWVPKDIRQWNRSYNKRMSQAKNYLYLLEREVILCLAQFCHTFLIFFTSLEEANSRGLFHRVTDDCIRHLVKNCRNIIDLNISGCKVS